MARGGNLLLGSAQREGAGLTCILPNSRLLHLRLVESGIQFWLVLYKGYLFLDAIRVGNYLVVS